MANEKDKVARTTVSQGGGSSFTGRVVSLVQYEFDDGSSVTAPEGEVSLSARSVAGTIGDIITIACKLFPKLCGTKDPDGGGGGGGGGCYVIIGPDGTKITICPPGKGGIA